MEMDPESYPMESNVFEFSDKSVRRSFIRKVYGILTVQLIITFGIVSIFIFIESIQQTLYENTALFWIPFGLSIVFMIILACVPGLTRKTPWNFIFLLLFTICLGATIGCICATYDTTDIWIAFGTTVAIVLALTLFAFQTKIDFTILSGMLLSLVMMLIFFGIFALIIGSRTLTIFYYCLGAFIFSIYIVFDTQIIIGGKHKLAISPEEYIFAALNLYLDVINIFLYLLAIIGLARG
ncbi:Protein lifeguard 1 [Armadillidium nasatum]|uniref:Protein lifeguard 1 n=1 Tax=Armadillidium nasatum TaxID=96803 RepID=A0A5N5T0B0_9CRUS|nr:Protein lifeguard 1 [Armadillidium nasatum]KAB7500466.1 Protein lifeguard 1 [Armadillidium nasatum]